MSFKYFTGIIYNLISSQLGAGSMGIFFPEIKTSARKKYEINLDFAACLLDITTHTLYANESYHEL